MPGYTCKVQEVNHETAMAGEAFPQPLHHHPLGLEWEAGVRTCKILNDRLGPFFRVLRKTWDGSKKAMMVSFVC